MSYGPWQEEAIKVSDQGDSELKKDPHVIKAICNVQNKCEKLIRELTGNSLQPKN